MESNILTLLVLASGFLIYFLIIKFGPYFFDFLFYENKKLKD